jgi:hypothetical protein
MLSEKRISYLLLLKDSLVCLERVALQEVLLQELFIMLKEVKELLPQL